MYFSMELLYRNIALKAYHEVPFSRGKSVAGVLMTCIRPLCSCWVWTSTYASGLDEERVVSWLDYPGTRCKV